MAFVAAGIALAGVASSRFEGVFAIKDASLLPGVSEGTCDPDDATVAIVTEEGMGKCFYYLYATYAEADDQFNGPPFVCISRIMFSYANGTMKQELKHGGIRMAYRTIRRATKKYNVCGKIFVNARSGQFGVASYHFVNEEKAFISFAHEQCSMWRLDDGSPMPREKQFQEVSFDRQDRIFRGVIDWSPTSFCGDQRWEHEMVFDEDFDGIVDGRVHHYTPDVSDRHSKEQVLYYKGVADDAANVLRYSRLYTHGDGSSTASPVDMDDRQWEDLEEMIDHRLRAKAGSCATSTSSFGSQREPCNGYKIEFEEVDTDFRLDTVGQEAHEKNDDETHCGICNARVGKRFLNRRHHCRACGKCVCSKCSPHSALLPSKHGLQGLQRVCTPCMDTLQEEAANQMRPRLSTCSTSLVGLDTDTNAPGSISVFEDSDAGSSTSLDSEKNCVVCGERVGKRYLNPRHHCKICYKAVCSGCSPNSVVLPGSQGLQRVCTPCMTITVQGIRPPRPSIDSIASSCSSGNAPLPSADVDVESPELRPEADPVSMSMSVVEDDDSYLRKESGKEPVENEHCCAACGGRLGKRFFRMRHRCRICGKAVCGECSPNMVVFPDMDGPQRVCTPCIAVPKS